MLQVSRPTLKFRDIKEVIEILGARPPKLTQLGEKAPKMVLSFGASGTLATYGLGVGQYLLDHHKKLMDECYFIGSGSGVLPAVALPLASDLGNRHLLKEYFEIIMKETAVPFHLFREAKRAEYVKRGLSEMLGLEDLHTRLRGRCSIFLHPDPKYLYGRTHGILDRHQILFGLPVSHWRSSADLRECMEAAMAPSHKHSLNFRGVRAMSSSKHSLSPQLDQSIRHIYVHGFAGKGYSSREKLHAHVFGRHGSLVNVSTTFLAQTLSQSFPLPLKYVLTKAYHQGYEDASKYHRWEEDPYQYCIGTE